VKKERTAFFEQFAQLLPTVVSLVSREQSLPLFRIQRSTMQLLARSKPSADYDYCEER
jgi:hypothetical protein